MPKRFSFLVSLFFSALIFTQPAFALVCTSPKKGAVGGTSAVGASRYYYTPFSDNLNIPPMLNRTRIGLLRNKPNPDDPCPVPCLGGEGTSELICCPAKKIRETIQRRGSGGDWLIFNEPFGMDEYPKYGGAWGAANDAAYTIYVIKKIEAETTGKNSTARFIVGWFTENDRYPFNPGVKDISNQWPIIIQAHPEYNLNPDINQVIAGWHIHPYDLTYEKRNAMIVDHPTRRISPGKELWLTEFNTTGLNKNSNNPCFWSNIDTDPNQTCVTGAVSLLNWLENTDYVTKYFWWIYNACDPLWNPLKDTCASPLLKYNESGVKVLNNLGKAFAEIPNDNGICRYSSGPTNTPIPTIKTETFTVIPGDVNGDSHVNSADFSIFSIKYGTNDLTCDFNKNGTVDAADYEILKTNYGR